MKSLKPLKDQGCSRGCLLLTDALSGETEVTACCILAHLENKLGVKGDSRFA